MKKRSLMALVLSLIIAVGSVPQYTVSTLAAENEENKQGETVDGDTSNDSSQGNNAQNEADPGNDENDQLTPDNTEQGQNTGDNSNKSDIQEQRKYVYKVDLSELGPDGDGISAEVTFMDKDGNILGETEQSAENNSVYYCSSTEKDYEEFSVDLKNMTNYLNASFSADATTVEKTEETKVETDGETEIYTYVTTRSMKINESDLTIVKQDLEIALDDTSDEIVQWGASVSIRELSTEGAGENMVYTSSVPAVASVDENGNVTIHDLGETVLSIQDGGNDYYNPSNTVSYKLIVEQNSQPIWYDLEDYYLSALSSGTNHLSIAEDAAGSISYSIDSSTLGEMFGFDPTIDESTGEVTVVWAFDNTTTVTATYTAGENDKYKNATATYTLHASRISTALKFEKSEVVVSYGDVYFENQVMRADTALNSEYIEFTVTSEEPENVITSNGDGKFNIIGAGEATVTATAKQGSRYERVFSSFSPSFHVTVNAKELNLNLSLENKTYGDDPFVVEAEFDSVESDRNDIRNAIVYTTDTTDQIHIDGHTVTILNAGEARITASYSGDNTNYANESVTKTFTISKAEIPLGLSANKKYGQKDPILTQRIKNQIWAGMKKVDKAGSTNLNVENEVFQRLFNEVSYDENDGYNGYDISGDAEGRFRPVGTYAVKYETAEDTNYEFKHGTDLLTVEEGFAAIESTHYSIEGLTDVDDSEDGEELWGRGDGTVKIVPSAGYLISKKDHGKDNWTSELVYTDAQEVTKEVFFIRQQTDGQISKRCTKTFGIDAENPTFEITDITVENEGTFSKILNFLTFGIFAKEALVINVKGNDAAPTSGLSKVHVAYNQTLDNTSYTEYVEPQTVNENGEVIVRIPLQDEDLKNFEKLTQFAFAAEDKVGNKGDLTPISAAVCAEGLDLADISETAGLIQIEQTVPEISVDCSDDGVVRGSGEEAKTWYGGDVEFTYTVTDIGETNSGIRLIHVVASGDELEDTDVALSFKNGEGEEVTPYDSDGETQPDEGENQPDDGETQTDDGETPSGNIDIHSSEASYYFIDSKKETLTFTVNTADIQEELRGEVTLKVYVTDNAGNESTEDQEAAVTTIYIDRDDPSVIADTGFTFEPANNNDAEGSPVDSTSYGFFFKEDTTVTVTAKDSDPSSDIKQLYFYTEDIDGNIKEYEPAVEGDSNFIGSGNEVKAQFIVPLGFKGQIYAKPEDYVGHKPDDYVHPYGTAIEDASIHSRVSSISLELNESTPYTDVDGRKLFDHQGVKVLMTVEDKFSGIGEITWEVDQEGESEGTTVLENVHEMTPEVGGTYDGWTIDAVDQNLITKMHRQITVSANVNDINVDLSFKDNAGNSSYAKTLNFSIDVTDPTINVSYDNNSPDSGEYYNADRVATVRVVERNFDASRVNAVIGSSSAGAPSIVWESGSSGSGDETVHTGTIRYHEDSDYTFDISCTDRANNASGGPNFASGTANPNKFTIDQTAPVVTVSYNNNDVSNGRYFKNARVQTVRIVEHNFDVDRVTFTRTATNEGASIDLPGISWSNSGDDHFATITYDRDGDYTFDVKVKDKAGNEDKGVNYGDSAAAKSFTIDQTIKEPEITGVEDGKSYKGDVKLGISFDDQYFESYSIKLTRTRNGEKNKDVTDQFITAIKTNGRGGSGLFDTFEKKQENDGIYTLTVSMTDLAGNSSVKTVTFTINRFGSIYVYEDYLRGLQDKYVREITEDIVITEINPDRLDLSKVRVEITRDGMPISSVIYTINPSTNYNIKTGQSGWYEYTYRIDPSNFTEDGVYKITISSVDEAGNTPETLNYENGAIIFRVDRTPPEISSVVGLEKAIVNAAEQQVKFSVFDALGLQKVSVYVNGELVLETDNFEDLINYTNSITLGQGMNQNVRIVATDLAGNTTDTEYVDEQAKYTFDPNYDFVHNITVSTNVFVRWYANTKLFWSSIVLILAAAGGLFFIIAKRRKKDEEEEEEQ